MIIGVQGSLAFDSYQVFMRAMLVAMSIKSNEDNQIHIYAAGPVKVNSFVSEFSNITEDSLKARGIRIRFFKVPPSWLQENVDKIDYFAYLSKPKEQKSNLAEFIDKDESVESGWFCYSH